MNPVQIILIIPAIREDFFKKLPSIPVDGVILDLEDSIALSHKGLARRKLKEFLRKYPVIGKKIIVRINSLKTKFGSDDLDAALDVRLDGIMYPKVDGPDEIEWLEKYISKHEKQVKRACSVEILPTLEKCKGIVQAEKIVRSSKRIRTIIFGTEDLHSELGIPRRYTFSNPLLTHALSWLVLVAKANGVEVIDGIFPYLGKNSSKYLKKEAEFAKQLGCAGKLAIHPSQVEILRETFSIKTREIGECKKKCDLLVSIAEKKGLAIGVYKDTLVGPPEISKCISLLTQSGESAYAERLLSLLKPCRL